MRDTFRRHFDSLGAESAPRLVENYLETVGECVLGALLSTAWKHPNAGSSGFITGRLMVSETIEQPRDTRTYPLITLREEWIASDQLVGFVRALLGPERSSAFPDLFHAPSAEHIYTTSGFESHSGWAETHLRLAARGDRVDPEWLPAVAPNLPPYQTWAEAVSTWVFGRPVTYGPDVPHASQLLVVLPDTRARALNISAGDAGINVAVALRETSDRTRGSWRLRSSVPVLAVTVEAELRHGAAYRPAASSNSSLS